MAERATTSRSDRGAPVAAVTAGAESPTGRVEEVAGRLSVAVARLHRTLRQHADSGLSPSQLSALVAIERHGSLTLGELAAHEGVAPPTVTGVVARLEADGNVERRPDPNDGRVVRVEVTPKGLDLVLRARERKDVWLTGRVAQLSAAELDQLAGALDVLDGLSERHEP
jgi:DNA-binding MarR family transcriptional regulator